MTVPTSRPGAETLLKAPLTRVCVCRIMYFFMTKLLAGSSVTPTLPLTPAEPVTLAKLDDVRIELHQIERAGLEGEIALTLVDVPEPLPGTKMPPLAIVVFPTAPAPVSAPPAFTVVSGEETIEPSTSRKPPFTVVVPV